MTETTVDLKNLMPTERKSTWRTAEERRMSDLTRVLEWLERRRGKKRLLLQKQKVKDEVAPGASEKADKKGAGSKKKDGKSQRETASRKGKEQGTIKNSGFAKYSWMYGLDLKNKQTAASAKFSKDGLRSSGTLGSRRESEAPELDIKDAIALESTQRPNPFRRQSSTVDPMAQDSMFNTRKVTLLREWSSKMPDSSYERKLKSLMEKGTEPKIETAKMLKPEEVLSCRYLRLSKNNIRTLVKLCKDAGLDVDIHPHMVESEIDSKKVFDRPGRGT
uniref:uncharacterized protein C16orf78 homolog n=1 Tax=Jaculus jaculus TaxID=51337 RepID=UPI001E1B2911|nr:uncharacterized protein C16orf78 homolog [Jaculus jaculus]